MTRREQIARIVDPTAFEPMTGHTPLQRQNDALAKADQIMGVFEAMSEPRPEVLDALRAVIRREYGIDQQSDGRLKRIYATTVAATLKAPTHDQ